MKQGIHPEYKLAKVHCACGNEFHTRSTQDDIHLDVCSVCHPFFTGKQRLMDTAGRVERFRRKWGGKDAEKKQAEHTEKPEEPAAEEEAEAPAEIEAQADTGADEAEEPTEPEAEAVEEEAGEEEAAKAES